jgi:hypothetical protein
MSEARASTDIKIKTKSSVTGIQTLEHRPYKSEITYPSGKVEKTKVE